LGLIREYMMLWEFWWKKYSWAQGEDLIELRNQQREWVL